MILPSSFKLDQVAECCIGLTSLGAAHYHSLRTKTPIHKVQVSRLASSLQFKPERLYTIDGKPPFLAKYFGGLHRTANGYVRIHDLFKRHRDGVCAILGLPPGASSTEVAAKCVEWKSEELEQAAFDDNAVISMLRSYQDWDASPQGQAVPDFPISIRSLGSHTAMQDHNQGGFSQCCLEGLQVIELSRVIAAPVAGRALAAHGAGVTWVSSPNLEDVPVLDRLLTLGKRKIQLDLDNAADVEKLKGLIAEADVFIQGYRPSSLAKRGLSPEELLKINPRLVYASLSAYPQQVIDNVENPWRLNRGFDTIVQTCTGMNVSESQHFDPASKTPALPMPCQALDHASGYFLATGILAALCKQLETDEVYLVEVSLATTAKYIRSLGQLEGRTGWKGDGDVNSQSELLSKYGALGEGLLEEQDIQAGRIRYLRYAAQIEGMQIE